jgi:hypothetical protein
MIESERIARNKKMLDECFPSFRVRLAAVVKELEDAGLRPRIQQAWRSEAEQLVAFKNGYSKVKYGFHNVTGPNGEKESLAADVWDDDRPTQTKTDFMLRLAAAAGRHGLTTGIRWSLSDARVKLIDDAIAAQNWKMPVYVGWDPLHVEASSVPIEEVKAGKRPPMPSDGEPEGGEQAGGGNPPAEGPGEVQETLKRRFKVEEVGTSYVKEYEFGNALRPVSLLPIPYVSQLGDDADAKNNDCGAASAVMLLRAYQKSALTPNDFYTHFGISGDPYLSIPQIMNAMSSLGLQTELKANLLINDLYGYLAAGRPLIVLIKYRTLVDAGLTEKTFQGPHFAVVVGLDIKNIYIHDPLYTDPTVGEAHAYPIEVFWKAWKDVGMDPTFPNPERAAIIPLVGIGFQVTRRVKINFSSLNVRSGPGLSYAAVGVLKKGDIVEIQREASGWGEISYNRWILLSYTLPA